jgi:hypothetical protein
MPKLSINEDRKRDFERLFSLPENALTLLIESLEKAKPGTSPRELSKELSQNFDFGADELEMLLHLIYRVNGLKLSTELSAEEITADFLVALEKPNDESQESKHYKDYLSRILNISGSLPLTVLAANLSYEREKLLSEVEIITDIRPIFDRNQLKGMVVIHALKIEFIDNSDDGDNQTIYLALDKDDMNKLESVIKLAKSRNELIESSMPDKVFVDL